MAQLDTSAVLPHCLHIVVQPKHKLDAKHDQSGRQEAQESKNELQTRKATAYTWSTIFTLQGRKAKRALSMAGMDISSRKQ